jgi:hypothetical protein
VQLEALQAAGRYGPAYDPPVVVPGVWVELGRRLVNSSTGEQIIESARVWLDERAPFVAPGDRLTLPNGHVGFAISVDPHDSPGQLAHVEVSVT